MSGNVWEWVSDFYSKDYYQISPIKNPGGPASGTKRVIRGGSWADEESQAWSFRRASRDPNDRSDQVGFRIVIESRVGQNGRK
jgi:formylglycine-generating enzyme required for sulfatase activity